MAPLSTTRGCTEQLCVFALWALLSVLSKLTCVISHAHIYNEVRHGDGYEHV